MKKFVALLLSMMLICLCISSAMAVSFSWTGSSTSFTRWSSSVKAQGNTWYISWGDTNLSSTQKAAVKIYSAPGVYASHTFYYSSESSASHSYLDSVTNSTDVYLAGKKYSGSADLEVSGEFHP